MKKSLLKAYVASVLSLGLVAFLGGLPNASGQPSVLPDLTLSGPGLDAPVTLTPEQGAFKLSDNGKSWELVTPGSIQIPGASWLTVQELRFDRDPLVYNSLLVQNNTASPQTYTFGVTLPTTWAAPNLIRGSIDTSLIGTAAQISTFQNFSIYAAQIDLATVKTLQNAPFILSTPQQAVSSSAQFGWELSNIPVNSSIGIQLRFTLSPGDIATIVSDFEVVQVPEPAALALLLLGGVALVLRRQKS